MDIFAASDGGVEIVDENLDECVLCELCLDAAPPGAVRVVKLYDGGARSSDAPPSSSPRASARRRPRACQPRREVPLRPLRLGLDSPPPLQHPAAQRGWPACAAWPRRALSAPCWLAPHPQAALAARAATDVLPRDQDGQAAAHRQLAHAGFARPRVAARIRPASCSRRPRLGRASWRWITLPSSFVTAASPVTRTCPRS